MLSNDWQTVGSCSTQLRLTYARIAAGGGGVVERSWGGGGGGKGRGARIERAGRATDLQGCNGCVLVGDELEGEGVSGGGVTEREDCGVTFKIKNRTSHYEIVSQKFC